MDVHKREVEDLIKLARSTATQLRDYDVSVGYGLSHKSSTDYRDIGICVRGTASELDRCKHVLHGLDLQLETRVAPLHRIVESTEHMRLFRKCTGN